jgi:diguanylate cyclase (GGDEF)-like protein
MAFHYWVVLTDIDSFKNINDTYGHDAGDAVLRTFAELLKRNKRASDICARLGGDEFVLVITHVDAENITLTIERFREQFAALSFPFVGPSVSTSASFGVAGLSSTPQKVVSLARLPPGDVELAFGTVLGASLLVCVNQNTEQGLPRVFGRSRTGGV